MKIFITADHHFNHENIIKYCGRPFKTIEEMNEFMIKKWNSKVSKEDIVVHLGDFGFGKKEQIEEIRKRLNGNIILIPGNHDKKIVSSCDFIVVRGNLQIRNLILSHRPLLKEEIPKNFINIHGHIHEKESHNGINVSVDRTNYEPLEITELLHKIKEE